jgi:hypothetical protein
MFKIFFMAASFPIGGPASIAFSFLNKGTKIRKRREAKKKTAGAEGTNPAVFLSP